MSESNHNNRNPKMEAPAANIVVPAAKDDCSKGEFIVHTKHTCDTCFQQPIIGRRYTSSVHSNFDLCARCFDAYSGPEISLTEAVLTRDKKHSRDFVLKLKIDNGGDAQVRRINVSEIWGKSISQLSFGKMMSIASSYAFPENKVDDAVRDAFIAKAGATYIDGDGDKITMTSNRELEDSFLQVLKKFPLHKPFRITVTVPKDEPSNVRVMAAGKATGMTKRIQFRKIEPKKKAFSLSMEKEKSMAKSPIVMEGKSKTTLRVTPQKFEKDFFVHARHTCDGCSKSPIIGTRHHATKIPDFDLCGVCFEKYEGEDLDFKTEIHPRDRRMQQKWLKRQLSDSSKTSSNIAGEWDKAKGNISDFLKKVQESGGSIESATVYASSPCQGFSASDKDATNQSKSSGEDQTLDALAQLWAQAQQCETHPEETVKFVPGSQTVLPPSELCLPAKGISDSELENSVESPTVNKTAEDVASPLKEAQEYANVEAAESESPPTTKPETPTVEEAPGSPAASHDESFFSDADGNGSIAEAIGRTLDVCVQAIEEAMADGLEEMEKVGAAASCSGKESPQKSSDSKTKVDDDLVAAAAVAVDAFSVASSMVSSMTDILKKMDDAKKADDASHAVLLQSNGADDAAASTSVPSVVTGATILKSEDGIEKKNSFEMPTFEDVIDGEDDWSVISDDKVQVKHDEDIARGAEMIDSALFNSDISTGGKVETDKSVSSVEPISPVVLAKWDTELVQLHELGFLHDRKNIDVLEHLEASHMGVDSIEKVTVQNAVEHLLGDRA
mmetsp:Transcript_34778/g.62621  ORF Transcript_34778/g.62621 Transcript_34778/m.62621 type:complete len:785 (-) Transcript_34778:106-2460(-)